MFVWKNRFFFGMALIAGAVGLYQPAQAQVPVIDGSEITQVVNLYNTAKSQLSVLQSVYNTAQQMRSAIGAVGTGNIAALAGWSNFGTGSLLNSLLGSYGGSLLGSLSGIAQVGGQPGLLSGFGSNPAAFYNFGSVQGMVQSLFYSSSSNLSVAQQDQIRDVRTQAAREAAQDGYALALSSRSQASQVTQQGSSLETFVDAAVDMRGDIKANSMIEIANYKQLSQIISILSAQLQLEAAAQIAADGGMSASITTAQ